MLLEVLKQLVLLFIIVVRKLKANAHLPLGGKVRKVQKHLVIYQLVILIFLYPYFFIFFDEVYYLSG